MTTSKSPLRFVRLAAFAGVLALAIVTACESNDTYVYFGQRYNAAESCLEDYKPIEVVPGTAVNLCRPVCFQVGQDTFLSRECPPLPSNATLLLPDAATCIAALAVSDASCSAEPVEEADAGDEEEEEDASRGDGAAPRDAAADG